MTSDVRLGENSVTIDADVKGAIVSSYSSLVLDGSVHLEAQGGESSALTLVSGVLGAHVRIKSPAFGVETGRVSFTSTSSTSPQVLSLESRAGFGASRIEYWSDMGGANEWRPAYVESTDGGGFTGGLKFCVNGAGASSKIGSVEVFTISRDGVTVDGSVKTDRLAADKVVCGGIDLALEIKKLKDEIVKLKIELNALK